MGKRKKIRRKIRCRIVGRLNIPNITVPCTIYTNKGKDRVAYFKRQNIKVCIANYFSREEEIKTLWPECVNCSNWIDFLPEAYHEEVFGKESEEFKEVKPAKRKKRIKIRRKIIL